MSTLIKKLKEHAQNYILVSETLDLIAQSSKSALNEVKEYLLISKIDEHTPIFYKDKDFRFTNALDDNKNGVFNSTHKALTKPLVGNEYFSFKSLNEFTPLDEYDIFAHKRGYYYVAQHSVGRFKTGAYVIGLDEDHANWLLNTGAIEKLSIQEVEDRQSAQVKEQQKQIEALGQQLAALTAENDQLTEQLKQKPIEIINTDKQQKNQDSKIVVYLAFILARKIPKYRKSNLNINAKQVGEAITTIAQELGLDKDDMHGFKRPDARLRDLINENEELLGHFENLIKDNEKT